MDLAKDVTRETHGTMAGKAASGGWGSAYGARADATTGAKPRTSSRSITARKHNIFRNLVQAGAKVSVVPATATFDEVMALEPDGIFLSNGPGDPAATADMPCR